MHLNEWKKLTESEQRDALLKFNALNGEGYNLAKEVADDFKPLCRWPFEKVNILNRFGEICICVYLKNEDYQYASNYPNGSHLGFRIFYGTENNYIPE